MEQLLNPSPEIKSAASGGDIAGAFDDFMRSFEAFKSENDTRLGEIERRSADVLSEQKVDRITCEAEDPSDEESRHGSP